MSKKTSESKKTKAISGAKAQAYFRDLFAAEEGVSADSAKSLLDTCAREIAQVRVRLPIPERRRTAAKPGGAAKEAEAPPAVEAEAFDPFTFSVVVVLTKEGKEGLERRLASIGSVSHLRALAKAQHIPVPPELVKISEIIPAIVSGTEQRIADRRAAAS